MAVSLNLKPEVEAGLLAQAQAMGPSLDQFLSRQIEILTLATGIGRVRAPVEEDQWKTGLDAWLDSFPQRPVVSGEALNRENWYPDRW